jgi:hypothetical protein
LNICFDWLEDADRQRFDQYRSRLAPYLLGLPNPTEATRLELERAARGHARLVDAGRRLYPGFLDKDIFSRIRAEARLRHRRARAPSAR